MPSFLSDVFYNGIPPWMPEAWTLVKVGGALGSLALIKSYCGGATCQVERKLHGKVILITGGTSGIGAAAALELAKRGGQIVLLTRRHPGDPFLVDYIEGLRKQAGHEMIYAEQVDLQSLHSVRKFATKWIDNSPPRRLDAIVLAAATLTPPGGQRSETSEGGVERTWMVNFLANFHLLGILSPALRAQPFDRDVRVVFLTCPSYTSSPPLRSAIDKSAWSPGKAYARSKLAMMVFGRAFQKHLDAYKRPDELPPNARVVFVDPGLTRTAGTMRWFTRGSLWGLLLYVIFLPFVWLFLKSPLAGAQSVLYALMEPSLGIARPGGEGSGGGRFIKECREVGFARADVDDEEVAKDLWEASDKLVEKVEKEQAVLRAKRKKEEQETEKQRQEAEKKQEIGSLVDAIKQGKAKEAAKEKEKEKQKSRARRKA